MVTRRWGTFEVLASGERHQVKRLTVTPGLGTSKQYHHHRAETWTVVAGTACVSIEQEISLLFEGQSVTVPMGARHQISNAGKVPLIVIETQIGPYLGEDDIVRLSH